MRRVMGKVVLFVLMCMLFAGCATFPPPRMEGGMYLNPEYEFQVRMPEGWKVCEEVPGWISDYMSYQDIAATKIMFFNSDTNGFISVSCHKTIFTATIAEGMKNTLGKVCEEWKKDIYSNPAVTHCHCEVYDDCRIKPDSFLPCMKHGCLAENEFQKVKSEAISYLYICHGGICSVSFSVLSDIKTFDENYKTLEAFMDTFNIRTDLVKKDK